MSIFIPKFRNFGQNVIFNVEINIYINLIQHFRLRRITRMNVCLKGNVSSYIN